MKADTVTKRKWFWAWQDEQEEAWLQEMSQSGLHFDAVTFPGSYRFIEGEPEDYVYRLDYQALRAKDKDSYLQLFEDAGWEHVGEMGGWVYFRIKSKPGETPEIYSDFESKIGKYYRVMIYLAIFLPILLILNPDMGDRYGIFSDVLEGLFAVMMLFYAYAMVQLFRRINQLKESR